MLFGQKMFLGQPLYGKVKSVNYTPKKYNIAAEEYQVIFQDYSDRINEYQRKYEFDANQNLVREIGLDFNFIRKYNKQNLLVEEISHSPQRKIEEVSTKKVLEYNENKSLHKISQYSIGNGKTWLTNTTTYKYNTNGKLIEETTNTFDAVTPENAPKITKKTYTYNKSGIPSSYTYYNGYGDSFLTKITYDKTQRKLQEVNIDNNKQKETSSIIFSYDDSKHITTSKYYYNGKLTSTVMIRYNSKNNIIETSTIGNQRKFKILYNYNEKGWLIANNYITNDSLSYVKAYKHDKLGNLIQCIYTDKNNRPIFSYALDIIYF
ncbi:hypothetical protein D3C87_225430 [compost metagenome]